MPISGFPLEACGNDELMVVTDVLFLPCALAANHFNFNQQGSARCRHWPGGLLSSNGPQGASGRTGKNCRGAVPVFSTYYSPDQRVRKATNVARVPASVRQNCRNRGLPPLRERRVRRCIPCLPPRSSWGIMPAWGLPGHPWYFMLSRTNQARVAGESGMVQLRVTPDRHFRVLPAGIQLHSGLGGIPAQRLQE